MIYENFKKRLISELEMKRDMLVVKEKDNRLEPLFGIKNANDKLYASILEWFDIIALRNVEGLVASLYQAKGISYLMENSGSKCNDMEFEIEGQRRVIEFKTQPNSMDTSAIRRFADRLRRSENPVMVVFLLKDGAQSSKAVANFAMRMERLEGICPDCVLFEEFLELAFGKEERDAFCEAMANFKDEMHKVIGYQVTELFNPYNLEKHREDLNQELQKFDYDRIRKQRSLNSGVKDISDNDLEILKKKYLYSGRYKILLGEGDFAESYLTSEWLYRKYVFLDDLDNTFIVSGFLKSVEQLLWDVILQVGSGRKIRNVEISEENKDEIDKTLGALEHFIGAWENTDLFNKSFDGDKNLVRKYVKAQIADWRDKYRNGYFHKHNLKDKKRIDEIREETYFLYMLILGAIKLTDEQVKKMG